MMKKRKAKQTSARWNLNLKSRWTLLKTMNYSRQNMHSMYMNDKEMTTFLITTLKKLTFTP